MMFLTPLEIFPNGVVVRFVIDLRSRELDPGKTWQEQETMRLDMFLPAIPRIGDEIQLPGEIEGQVRSISWYLDYSCCPEHPDRHIEINLGYDYIRGEVFCETAQELQEVIEKMKNGGWIVEDGECDHNSQPKI